MAQMTPAELEEFQHLSDRYQANLPGPLIGEKLTMDVLVTEYAQADPTFVAKTTGLAATHSRYRAVKGDGQCGWRATVFCYFETLLNSGDTSLVQQEKLRFESFKEMMIMIGYDYDLMVDMFDSTWELFDNIHEAVAHNISDENVVLQTMNDENKSNSVVYHFKMIASAFMGLREDDYAPFLDMSVQEYRISRIDPTNQEIDQIGLQVLTNAIINDAGFGLEVLYLDRSMGDEVTPYQFSNSLDGPTIRLLYRPGHYDIIYKETQPLQVFLQHHLMVPQQIEDQHHSSGVDVIDYLWSSATSQNTNSYLDTYSIPSHYIPTHSQHPYYEGPSTIDFNPMPYIPPSQEPPPTSLPTRHAPPPSQPQSHDSGHTSRHSSQSSRSYTVSPSPAPLTPVAAEPQIRFSSNMTQMQRNFAAVPIRAATGNSTVSSHAHIGASPADFQPQQYNPNNDYINKS